MFRGMLPNIPGNAARNSGECPQAFRGMSVLLKEMKTQGQSSWNENFMEFVVQNSAWYL